MKISSIIKNNKSIFIITTLLVVVDLAWMLLDYYQVYFISIKHMGFLYPILFNTLLVGIIMILKKRYWLLVIPLCLCVVLLAFSYFFSKLTTSEYQFITSPKRSKTLVIEYRVATLGESRYIYNFYQTIGPHGILMKKLDGQDLTITHDQSIEVAHPSEIVRMNHPNWVSENEVVLHSIEGDKVIALH